MLTGLKLRRQLHVLGHLPKVAVSVDTSTILRSQLLERVQEALVRIKFIIVHRLKHGKYPTKLASAAQLDQVQLAEAGLREARLAEGKDVQSQVEPDVAPYGRHRHSSMQLVDHEVLRPAVQNNATF